MIAWLALALALVAILLWAVVGLVGWRLYRQARPMLQMMGLGASLTVPPAPPGQPDAPSLRPAGGSELWR